MHLTRGTDTSDFTNTQNPKSLESSGACRGQQPIRRSMAPYLDPPRRACCAAAEAQARPALRPALRGLPVVRAQVEQLLPLRQARVLVEQPCLRRDDATLTDALLDRLYTAVDPVV